MWRRRDADWLPGVDVTAAGLLGLAALLLLLIGVSGNAGPFGGALIPVLMLLLVAVPLVLVALVARLARRPPWRSGRLLFAGVLALGIGVASIPGGDAVRRWWADREVRSYADRLDAVAERCARARGGLDAAVRCVERTADVQPIVCAADSCWTTRHEWNDAAHDTVGVDLAPYLDGRPAADGIWYGR